MLAVALSQSGATEEIVETLAWARDCGARTLAITNGDGSPLTRVADVAFVTVAGAELAVPATKTFTTQLAALAVLAIALGADLERACCAASRTRSSDAGRAGFRRGDRGRDGLCWSGGETIRNPRPR